MTVRMQKDGDRNDNIEIGDGNAEDMIKIVAILIIMQTLTICLKVIRKEREREREREREMMMMMMMFSVIILNINCLPVICHLFLLIQKLQHLSGIVNPSCTKMEISTLTFASGIRQISLKQLYSNISLFVDNVSRFIPCHRVAIRILKRTYVITLHSYLYCLIQRLCIDNN